VLAVGDSGKVELIYLGEGGLGQVIKDAKVFTNDTVSTRPTLQMIMEVVPNFDSTFPVTISPAKYDFFAAGKEKEGYAFKATINNISEDVLRTQIIDYPEDIFKIKLSSHKIKPKKSAQLKVELKKEFKEKNFNKGVTLEFSSAKESSRFTIPLLNPIEAKPDTTKKAKAMTPGK
jgi:hypothetical protein